MSKDSCAEYYQKRKKIPNKSRERYQNLTEEEQNKKGECGRERHRNLFEDEKQKLVE